MICLKFPKICKSTLCREENGKRTDTPVLAALRSLLARGGLIGATRFNFFPCSILGGLIGATGWFQLAISFLHIFFDSSAGIEVLQSEVVILGGLSWNALAHGAQTSRFYDPDDLTSATPKTRCSSSDPDDLTYDPQGGLGLWPGPIIDAHFRERGRQVR